MNNIAKCIIFAGIGIAIGVFSSYKYFENKYKKISDEEIESVKEMFKTKHKKQENIKKEEGYTSINVFKEKSSIDNYKNNIDKYNYSSNVIDDKKPYVISPSDFGTEDGYDNITLTYYIGGNDKVLADDMDEPIYDIDDVVGEDSLNQFGVYEEDCVYVRNEKLKCDYEICIDQRNWEEVTGDKKSEDD